jgi:hypothetical protein
MVANCPETGLLAVYTEECRIVHNTIFEPKSRQGRLIWAQQENDGLLVAANLLVGSAPRLEGKGKINNTANVVLKDSDGLFVDAAQGNLHLHGPAPKATQTDHKPLTKHDFDRRERSELVAGADDPAAAERR